MRRLSCIFVVRIWLKQVFSWRGSYKTLSGGFLYSSCVYMKLRIAGPWVWVPLQTNGAYLRRSLHYHPLIFLIWRKHWWKGPQSNCRVTIHLGERGGSGVECRTPEREVRGSRPTAAVLCPWARHFTPRKYWLITQEAMAPSRHDWKIVDWDVKPQHNQPPSIYIHNLNLTTVYEKITTKGFIDPNIELRHDKTSKMSVRPAKTQISLGIRPVWSES